jgi:hypothetical protein
MSDGPSGATGAVVGRPQWQGLQSDAVQVRGSNPLAPTRKAWPRDLPFRRHRRIGPGPEVDEKLARRVGDSSAQAAAWRSLLCPRATAITHRSVSASQIRLT